MVATYLPWLISVLAIWALYLQGNVRASGWALAIGNQALWLTWIVAAGAWGFLPLNIVFSFMYVRNYRKWRRELA